MTDSRAGVDAGSVLQSTESWSRAEVRNEMMALRCVTLSATGPRVSVTEATASAITIAR
jgi:hypothetical protein